jgi:hypothetical protein
MVHVNVEPGEAKGPMGLVITELLRCHKVLKILVACPDFKLVTSTFQGMVPVLQGMDDCKHLLVMDLIVTFHSIETL